mgnify:CR=1 FL=1|tara:strand:- start:3463 stop:4398 length:936 start_codon:yes stop_codon:yes gene_type:complete
MIFPTYFNPKKSLNLFGLINDFNFLKNIYKKKKLPKVLMLSGKKGSGKSTLINHLMFLIFDTSNYNEEKKEIKINSPFYNQFSNDIHSNIIYLAGSNFKQTKIEDIRILKSKIYQTSISNKPRFIIFDDVELFNHNSLNALLKIIEEPSKNNYFILINNKSKPLIDTIKSRCLDVKIILSEDNRKHIINSLVKKFDINLKIDPVNSHLTPGHLIKYNCILEEHKISLEDDLLKNLGILLNLYKKEKDIVFIEMTSFITDNYFGKLNLQNVYSNDKIIENKRFVLESINEFLIYKLNQNALLNNINNVIHNE